jgi:hypothetical protein
MGVAGERELALALYLVGVSRKLARPLSARVRGPSTSGKSHVIECVARLMPPEAVIAATQLTQNALFHMAKGALRHKFIVAGERSRKQDDDVAEMTRALRELQSAGRVSKLMPMKMPDGRIETVRLDVDGPIAFVESTTLGEVFAEDENRAVPLYTDETPEQTGRILQAIAERYEGRLVTYDTAHIRQVHHTAQRLLARLEVVVPFAGRLVAKLPKTRVETRRILGLILATLNASALLHQFQRRLDPAGRLIAEATDYRVTELVLSASMRGLLCDALCDGARRFADRLREWFPGQQFTAPEAMKKETVSPRSVYGWLRELKRHGIVVEEERASGSKAAKLTVMESGPIEEPKPVLPPSSEVCG